ncbi:MAG TPA: aminoglycoside phosphotransferase family protein [Blastocatellia bacterium]|nr:aminoglycoside phosphotransferase family protein [Blastocatellia bacterium]
MIEKVPAVISDERLPQLGELLDPSAMQQVFERELTNGKGLEAGYRLTACRILQIKYRPGRRCLVTYALQSVELSTEREREQLLSVTVAADGERRIRLFPDDRKLTGLPVLVDSTELQHRILPEVVAASHGAEWAIDQSVSEVVHYAAERACTVRARVQLRHRHPGRTASPVFFGKTYVLDESVTAWDGLWHLWNSEARRAGRLVIPRPLVYQPEIRTVWQAGLEGETIIESDPRRSDFRELLAGAGAAIAALHEIQSPFARRITIETIVSRLEEAVELISRFRPSLNARLRSLFEQLQSSARSLGTRPVATLHGDLHLQNLLVTRDRRVALIDWDNFCQGDPLQDLGSFVAALYYRGLLEGRASGTVETSARQLIEAYGAVAESALAWHTAAALIYERAFRCVTKLRREGLAILEELIETAEQFAV